MHYHRNWTSQRGPVTTGNVTALRTADIVGGERDVNDVTFAARLQGVKLPVSHAIMNRVRDLRRQGIEVINFGTKGDTPRRAKEAAIEMLASDDAAYYTDSKGLIELRQAIARKLHNENDIEADPETDIITTLGGMEGLFSSILALVDRDDEALVDDPGWFSFEPIIRIAGATPVPVPWIEANGFGFDIDRLRDKVTARTKLLILCNPDNPTGRVLDRSDLEAIAQLAQEFNFLVIVDEAYEYFTYDGRKHISLASLDGMWQRTITIQTVSKIYNMFGWRIGWIVADKDIIRAIQAVHSRTVGCPVSFAQAGAAAVLGDSLAQGDLPIWQIVQNYEKQRNAMVEGLGSIPGVTCGKPQGAYFAFPNIKRFGMSSVDMSEYLLEEGRVATAPGSAFGAMGEGHLRLLINSPVEEIEYGVARIAQTLAKLDGGR